MAELLRSQELRLREENGDASAAMVPTVHLRLEHPFRVGDRARDKTGELYFWFPRDTLWSAAAQGFGQLRGSVLPNATACYKGMIEMAFFLASAIGEGMENGLHKQFVTWTVVPRADDARNYAGFLLRCTYQIDMLGVHKVLAGYLDTNAKNVKKATAKGQSPLASGLMASYLRLTHDSYVTMCDYYIGQSVGDRSRGFQELDDPTNPYNPENVFSLKNATKMMGYATVKAEAEFCQRSSYLDANGLVSFPADGDRTWLLPPSQLVVSSMHRIYMPHAPRGSIDVSNAEFKLFALNSWGTSIGGSDDDQLQAQLDAEDAGYDSEAEAEAGGDRSAERLFAEYLKVSPNNDRDASNNLITYKKRVAKRMAALPKKEDDERLWAEERRKAQIDCIRWLLSDIVTDDETADVGDALKSIARWSHKHLEVCRNFMIPTRKWSANLSRFADLQIRETTQYETTWAINTAHAELRSLRLACMHVYYYSPFHVHTCLFGPPGAGKSKAFQVNNDLMIDGTTRDIGSESAKAKMTPGKKTDLAVETHEDILPSHLGVSNFVGSNKSAMTSNTDQESLLKYRLTKGRVKGVYKSVVNGVHSMVEIDSFCNTVMLIGMNALLSQVPKSISDRFNNILFQYRNRVDEAGNVQSMFMKFLQAEDPRADAARKSSQRRAHRNQFFHAVIQLLCWAGVFERPDMSVPVLIWTRALSMAQQKGLQDTNNVRHFERLKFHCETLVVEDTIDRVLDSELSPLDINEDFKIEDIIHFEKHFYATTEHASMALGLLQHQYENPVISAVEKFFKTHLLRAKILANDIGKPDPIPDVQIEMSYYYVTRFETSLQANSSSYDREKAMQQSEQLRRLAMFAHKRMDPKPSLEEVLYSLECLSTLQIDVDSNTKAGEKVRIPALAFSREGEVMVAVHMMKHYDKDRLQSCLRSVLNHESTKKKNILYGRVKENLPYLWQSMRIFPVPGQKLTMEHHNYFSPQLKELTQINLEGVAASYKPGVRILGELQASDLANDGAMELFSETSHKDVDMDLDEFVAAQQAQKIGLHYFPPTRDAPNYNTSPDSFNRAVMQALDDEKQAQLKIYPRDFGELNKSQYKMGIRADKARNPEKYSLRHSLKRRRVEDEEESKSNHESQDEEMEDAAVHGEDVMCSDHDVDGDDEDDDDGAGAEPAAMGGRGPFGAASLSNSNQNHQQPAPNVWSAFTNVPQILPPQNNNFGAPVFSRADMLRAAAR